MMKEMDRIDKAITEFDDGKYKKQRMTEAIPVTYADKESNIAATYYISRPYSRVRRGRAFTSC